VQTHYCRISHFPSLTTHSLTYFIGIIFLLVIGALFQKQPDLFKGLTIDPSAAAAGSYQAAGLYAATFAISIAYWLLDDMRHGNSSLTHELTD